MTGHFDQLADDLRAHLDLHQLDVAFDVGANRGQTVQELLQQYPDVTIHAFEPVSATFLVLQRKHGHRPNIHLVNCALGSASGPATMTAKDTSTGNRIVSDQQGGPTQQVQVITGDEYCRENGIGRIDFLKIDTEGFDLHVLKGFEAMLASQQVAVIQVEAAMNPSNKKHVAFNEFTSFLENRNYYLFHIYEQVHEMDGRAVLRRANLVLCSQRLVSEARKARHG